MKFTLLLAVFLLLPACSSIPTTDYKDTSHLETPPGYNVKKAKSEKPLKKEQDKKGLGDLVSMTEHDQKQTLIIDKTFDRAWIIVAKALDLNDLEITDRNRSLGVFLVDYDPDIETGNTAGFFSFHLFNDDFEESSYQLTLVTKDEKINVASKIVPPELDSALYEDEEDREQPKDGSSQLIKTLYETIRDDLPNNFK